MCVLLIAILTTPLPAMNYKEQKTIDDFSEGGHLETDYGANFMAEWWYLNGKARLVASDGEERNIGFFVTLGHQESHLIKIKGVHISHLLTFYGLYHNDTGTTFDYIETFVPRTNVSDYIALNSPFVDYKYPDGSKRFYGSPLSGYNLNYISDDIKMDLFFQPKMDKTIDHSDKPLNFTAYEHPYGTLHGSIYLNDKEYNVTEAEGYMDHMIPIGGIPWTMYMHGWTWFEVTTKDYQAVAYAVRGAGDGYDKYSFKHLTLLNRNNGKVLAEYEADQISIMQTEWTDESQFGKKRPKIVVFSTPDLNVKVYAQSLVYFNRTVPSNRGFVDFMAFQPDEATIQYKGKIENGSAFFEYMVSDGGSFETILFVILQMIKVYFS